MAHLVRIQCIDDGCPGPQRDDGRTALDCSIQTRIESDRLVIVCNGAIELAFGTR
jgi:hypothetical protein